MKDRINFKSGQYYDKEKYEVLQNLVLEALKEKRDSSLQDIRNYIFNKSGIMAELHDFYINKKYASGAVINLSTPYHNERIVLGNQQEVLYENDSFIPYPIEMKEDSIFDIASITKIFTAISTLQLISNNSLSLDDTVGELVPQFVNLKELTVADLLSFAMIKTDERVDHASSIEEAEERLFNAKHIPLEDTKDRYNDFAPMVLKYVIESASGMKYDEYLEKHILEPLQMKDTHVKIPIDKLDRVANTNYDGRFYVDGNYIIRTSSPIGHSSDTKAVALGQPEGKLTGHAGLFTTSHDLNQFGHGLINHKILNSDLVEELGTRKVGRLYNDETGALHATQFFSYLTYVTNPSSSRTEVHHALSPKSFAGAGWTGTLLNIDPENKIVFSLLSNRTHNRMTHIADNQRENIKENKHGQKVILLPNGVEMIDSSKYAHLRNNITEKCIELAIMYRMLEDIVGLEKDLSYSLIKY